MNEKKTQEYGEVDYTIKIRLEYSTYTNEGAVVSETKVTKDVSLNVGRFSAGDGLSIGKVVAFQKGGNAILQLTKELLMNGTHVKFTLSKSAYEHVPEYTMHDELGTHKLTAQRLEYLAWTFEDSSIEADRFELKPDEDGAGLYLQPDTENSDVDETQDGILYWKRDILESLEEMNI